MYAVKLPTKKNILFASRLIVFITRCKLQKFD